MTLIEVLAALLLMGSILVALVTARGRLVNQHAEAVEIQQAVQAADALLVTWWAADPPSVPIGERGELPSHPGWVWTTTELGGVPDGRSGFPGPETLGAAPGSPGLPGAGVGFGLVRLSILDERDPTRPGPKVLTQVDVLVPRGDATNRASVPPASVSPSHEGREVALP